MLDTKTLCGIERLTKTDSTVRGWSIKVGINRSGKSVLLSLGRRFATHLLDSGRYSPSR